MIIILHTTCCHAQCMVQNLGDGDRVMLGTDWPVYRLAGEYGQVVGIPF